MLMALKEALPVNLESISVARGGKGASDELIRHFHMPKDDARTPLRGREDTVFVGDVRHGRSGPPLRIVLEIRSVFPEAVIDRVWNYRGISRRVAVIYAVTHSDFVEQVRYAQRAVSAGVETKYAERLRNVALRRVVTIAFVVAMGDVEIENREGLFPFG
jgi:hypothetical protein